MSEPQAHRSRKLMTISQGIPRRTPDRYYIRKGTLLPGWRVWDSMTGEIVFSVPGKDQLQLAVDWCDRENGPVCGWCKQPVANMGAHLEAGCPDEPKGAA